MTWPTLTLGELTAATRPICYGVLKPGPYVQDGVPLLRIVDMAGDVVARSGYHRISSALDSEFHRSRLRGGEVLLSIQGTVGRVAIAPATLAGANISRTIAVIEPDSRLDPRFLRLYLMSRTAGVGFQTTGTTRASLNIAVIRAMPVPVPPLDEQRRIVDLLEGHLSRLDVAEQGLRMATRRADSFLAAGLTALVVPSGLAHVQSLDPTVLGQDQPPQVPLPDRWRWARWADLGESQNGKAFPSKDYQDEGVRLLRPGNLAADGTLTWAPRSTRCLPSSYLETHRSSLLNPGDIVMNMTAQSLKDDFLGRVCIVSNGDTSLLNQRIARLVAKDVHNEYALTVFRSRLFRHYVKSLSTGSLIQHMFTSQVKRFWVPVPPYETQIQIADRAADLDGDMTRLRADIARSLAGTATLRRSLLARAFSGRLTAAPADLSDAEEIYA